jgi:hypothetical protein
MHEYFEGGGKMKMTQIAWIDVSFASVILKFGVLEHGSLDKDIIWFFFIHSVSERNVSEADEWQDCS